jgi:uncharacterized OB-fold protein
MSEARPPRKRRPTSAMAELEAAARGGAPTAPAESGSESGTPFLLDFYPLEDERYTRIARFYERLRAGHLSTTRCAKDGWHWPPRIVCPTCHTSELEWADLPMRGRIYAFSAVLAGAPLGMEADLPFVVGLVDLDGVPLRLFGRIAGAPWTECRVGQPVRVEPFDLPDGRVFYRFRVDAR